MKKVLIITLMVFCATIAFAQGGSTNAVSSNTSSEATDTSHNAGISNTTDTASTADGLMSTMGETASNVSEAPIPIVDTATVQPFRYEIGPFSYKSYKLNTACMADLKKYETKILNTLANLEYPKKIKVIGHADTTGPVDPVPGQESLHPGNNYWAKKRAEQVVDYFVKKHNISKTKFEIISKGESAPKPGLKGGSSSNRRVEIVYE